MTEVNVGELSFIRGAFPVATWTVPDFFFLARQRINNIVSSTFEFEGASWKVRLLPHGRLGIDPCIQINVFRSFSHVPEHSLIVTLGLKTRCGEEHRIFQKQLCIKGKFSELKEENLTLSELEQRRNSCAPDSTLTVHYAFLSTALESVDIARTEVVKLQKILASVEKLQSDYKKLLEGGAESDVCLVVLGKEFRAHKNILKARSPVFCAMFDHETEEKASGKVNIDDLDPDSFRDFLEYVYAGRVESLSDDNAFGLYVAADKYDLQALKSECLEYMRRSLSVDSFYDVMMLSLRHEEEELMDLVADFFKKNMPKIIVTTKWQLFHSENASKANELLIKAFVPAEEKP